MRLVTGRKDEKLGGKILSAFILYSCEVFRDEFGGRDKKKLKVALAFYFRDGKFPPLVIDDNVSDADATE